MAAQNNGNEGSLWAMAPAPLYSGGYLYIDNPPDHLPELPNGPVGIPLEQAGSGRFQPY